MKMNELSAKELKMVLSVDIAEGMQLLDKYFIEKPNYQNELLLLKGEYSDLKQLPIVERLPLLKEFRKEVFAFIDSWDAKQKDKPKAEKKKSKGKKKPKAEKAEKKSRKEKPLPKGAEEELSADDLLKLSNELKEEFNPEKGEEVLIAIEGLNTKLDEIYRRPHFYDYQKVGTFLTETCKSYIKIYDEHKELVHDFDFDKCQEIKLALRLVEKSGDAEYAKKVMDNYGVFRKYANKFIPLFQLKRSLFLKCFSMYGNAIDEKVCKRSIQVLYKWEDFMIDFVMQYDKAAKRVNLQTDNPVEFDDEQIDNINIEDLLQGVGGKGAKTPPKKDDGEIDVDATFDEVILKIETELATISKNIATSDTECADLLFKMNNQLEEMLNNGEYSGIETFLNRTKSEWQDLGMQDFEESWEFAIKAHKVLIGLVDLLDFSEEKYGTRLKGVFKGYKSKLAFKKTLGEIKNFKSIVYDYCERVDKPIEFAEQSYLVKVFNKLEDLKFD